MPLTSAAVGLLLEKNQLKLDDEIQRYVPAFPKKQWPVTLRQLMGHVAGVRNDGGDRGAPAVASAASARSTRCGPLPTRRSCSSRVPRTPLLELRLDPS